MTDIKQEALPSSKTSKTVSGSLLYLLEIAVNSLLPLIAIPIITHRLEPAEYGVYALAQVYALIAVGIVNLGMSTGYERNFFLYEDDSHQSGALLSTVTAFVLWNIALLVFCIWLWRDSLSEMILGQAHYSALLFCVVAGVGLTSLANYYLTYLKNKGFAASFVKLNLLRGLTNFLFILLFLLYFDFGVEALAYAFFLASVFLLVAVGIGQFSNLPVSFNKSMLWDVLKISLPLTPRVFFGFLGTQFDKIMLGMMATLGGVGVYSIGQKVAYIIFQFMTALDRVFIPDVYRRLFAREKEGDVYSIGQYLLPFAYISIFVAMMFALFSEEVFALALPESYAGGVDIVIVLSVYFASMFVGKITGTQLIYAKKTHISMLLSLVGIALNVLLNIPMIIHWGAIGAAWATMIAGVMINLLSYRVAQRYVSVDWQWGPMAWMYGVYITAVAMLLLVHATIGVAAYWLVFCGKLMFVAVYLYLGTRIGIVTVANMRLLYSEARGMLMRRKSA